MPPLEFSSLIMPFYIGAMEAMEKGQYDLAMRMIDLIDLLQEKTRGNLTGEEREFLLSTATNLKLMYLKKTGGEK